RDKYFYDTYTIGPNEHKGFLLPALAGYQWVEVRYEDESLVGMDSDDYYDLTFGLCPGLPRGYAEWGNKRDVVWLRDDNGFLAGNIEELVGLTVQFTSHGKISPESTVSLFTDQPEPGTPSSVEGDTDWVSESDFLVKSYADGDI